MESEEVDSETEASTKVQKDCEDNKESNEGHLTSYGIEISRNEIKSISVDEQDIALKDLGVSAYEQEDFEEGVIKQVDKAINEQKRRIERESLKKDLKDIGEEFKTTQEEIEKAEKTIIALSGSVAKDANVQRSLQSLKSHKETKRNQLQKLLAREKSVLSKLQSIKAASSTSKDNASSTSSNRNFLEDFDIGIKDFETNEVSFQELEDSASSRVIREQSETLEFEDNVDEDKYDRVKNRKRKLYVKDDFSDSYSSSEEYIPYPDEVSDEITNEEDDNFEDKKKNVKLFKKRKKRKVHHENLVTDLKSKKERTSKKIIDDGDVKAYNERMRILRLKKRLKNAGDMEAVDGVDFSEEEENDDKEISLKKGFSLPCKTWRKLYKYQRTGVKWLWELHNQEVGGILGDEMGLGKTIQVITFLTGVKKAKENQGGFGPVLITCPATVLHQWVKEFYKWSPEFRVAILHESGSFNGRKEALIKHIVKDKGVLVTSYSNLRIHQNELLRYHWDYVILDEGHKIRNPDAEITLACKQFATPHRLILSGSPLQNNLKELWSLFDFIFPGKLGTLPVFMTEFSVPITLGGYANASDVQVQTAFKCACILRDTISPYLLRRMKKDVNLSINLPSKNEQVLFCRLTDEQRDLYKKYINSYEVSSILAGRMKIFPGLIMLRKICNHPDLSSAAGSLDWMKSKQTTNHDFKDSGDDDDSKRNGDGIQFNEGYGFWKRSGKMMVIESLLKMWKEQNHRVLLFSQTKQMLDILESFLKSCKYTYVRMDGSTSIGSRQPYVDKFNQDKSIFIFLLTTRVGGLGLNLTGADRVVIYDPDWNPSTDTQARERSWRIGQNKHVTIYRLLTTGTIEEKIYHRQIFKQFLVNRVLKNPAQRRFFKSNDLFELFTLGDEKPQQATETSALFAGTGSEVNMQKIPDKVKVKPLKKQKRKALSSKIRKRADQRSEEEGSAERKAKDVWKLDDSDLRLENQGDIAPERSSLDGPRTDKVGSLIPKDIQKTKEVLAFDDSDRTTEDDIANIEQKSTAEGSQIDITSGLGESSTRLIKNVWKADESDLKTEGRIGLAEQDITSAEPRIDNTASLVCTANRDGCEAERKYERECREHEKLRTESIIKDGNKIQVEELGFHQSIKRKTEDSVEEKNKKRKKRKKKIAKVEGMRINYLDKHSIYKDEEEKVNEKKLNKKHDKEILNALFKTTGVHSALKHDKIVEAGNPDYVLVEKEAERVAKQASEALRRSRALCRDVSVGVPTWTGTNGSAGIPNTQRRPRFGVKKAKRDNEEISISNDDKGRHFDASHMLNRNDDNDISSAALLERMRARNAITGSADNAEIRCNHYNINLKSSDSKETKMIEEIRHFVASEARNAGKATTQEILQKFKPKIENDKNALFKEMLKQVCEFRKINGVGTWLLKNTFK